MKYLVSVGAGPARLGGGRFLRAPSVSPAAELPGSSARKRVPPSVRPSIPRSPWG